MEKIPYLGQTLTRWRVGDSTFVALPERGARLMYWNITMGDGSVRDVILWPELKSLEAFHKTRGGNPILFPFCARSFDKGEIGFWRDARGVRRPMPTHGVARQGAFRTTRIDAGGFEALFVPDDEARMCYPFQYEFRVEYRFAALGLTCNMVLENLGDEPLPWSAGHHFYFAVPWGEGAARGDYLIRIPADQRLRQDASGHLVDGPKLGPLERMDNPDLVDTFHTRLRGPEVVFGEKGLPGDVVVRLGSDSMPPAGSAFVTWTQSDDSPFYCVEPWMGPANAPEHKTGLHLVAPGARETFSVSVAIR
ncbi:MAG: aldose epimerase [Opitutaceae bacterium]|jgi:galactose mutarotase-like enzyme